MEPKRTHKCYCPFCHKEIHLPIFTNIADPDDKFSPCTHFCEADFLVALFRSAKQMVHVTNIKDKEQ